MLKNNMEYNSRPFIAFCIVATGKPVNVEKC